MPDLVKLPDKSDKILHISLLEYIVITHKFARYWHDFS